MIKRDRSQNFFYDNIVLNRSEIKMENSSPRQSCPECGALGLALWVWGHDRFLNLLYIMFGLGFIDMLFEVVDHIIKLIWLALA